LALDAHREEARVLEEERALLREEQREAVEVHLLFVRFDLREVRVDREVEGQARGRAPLEVAARAGVGLAVRERRVGRLAEDVRRNLQVALRGRAQAFERS